MTLAGTSAEASAVLHAFPTSSSIIINGDVALLEAYNIGGYNFFKLRDFLNAVDVGVWYDELTDTIHIETDKGYDPVYRGPAGDVASMELDGTVEVPAGTPNEADTAGEPDDVEIAESVEARLERLAWEYRLQVVDMVNTERAAVGVSPLEPADILFEIAQFKCTDMATNDYFAHESPTYGDLEALFDLFDIDFRIIGENIAMGHVTPEHVMHDWMESPGHRDNILDPDYVYIGVGLVLDDYGTPYWAQAFLRY